MMPQKQILLVDDSKSARFVLLALLQKKGYAVATAESAENALEMLRESKPDAIFMDHMMPGMDGFQATQAIKEDPSTAHIPVVMCTSNDQPKYVREAKKMGSVGILSKPPSEAKLAEILDALDQEIAGTPAAGEVDEQSIVAMPGPEEFKTALREVLPSIVYETFEPLIEAKLLAQSEALSAKVLQESADHTLATVRTALGEKSDVMRHEILREARTQSEALDEALIAGVLPSVLQDVSKRLAVISAQLRRDMKSEVSTLSSQLIEDQVFIASIESAVAPKIEARITEIARAQAKSTAKETAEEIGLAGFSNATHAFSPKFQTLNRKINLLAAGAALVGIISAAVAYFLP